MVYKDPEYKQKYNRKYNEKNKEYKRNYNTTYKENLNQYAIDSIISGKILDRNKWNVFCDKIKSKSKKHPYSEELTNDIIFEMMLKGCFYCGDIATGIDRIDSKLNHTSENCVASCWGCNCSKGASDSATFIRKAYYRARGEYIDDIDDIWFVLKNKPSLWQYKKNSENKGVPFDLSKEYFDILTKSDCMYCNRSPSTWFGIDRVIPSRGYVIGNVVSCCYDCNLDKLEDDVDIIILRNRQIAYRVDVGELTIEDCERVVIHQGSHPSSKKVCAYGKVYESMAEASVALGKSSTYVSLCIRYGRHSNDIFMIDDDV